MWIKCSGSLFFPQSEGHKAGTTALAVAEGLSVASGSSTSRKHSTTNGNVRRRVWGGCAAGTSWGLCLVNSGGSRAHREERLGSSSRGDCGILEVQMKTSGSVFFPQSKRSKGRTAAVAVAERLSLVPGSSTPGKPRATTSGCAQPGAGQLLCRLKPLRSWVVGTHREETLGASPYDKSRAAKMVVYLLPLGTTSQGSAEMLLAREPRWCCGGHARVPGQWALFSEVQRRQSLPSFHCSAP